MACATSSRGVAAAWFELAIVQAPLAQISWYHDNARREVDKPIGVAQWEPRLVESLPAEREGRLPTIAQIEAELGGEGGAGAEEI